MSETITTASPADRPVTPADTFCSYLAKQFVAKKGFAVGTVPEAESLGAASDIVLTSHGTPFTILCLIDREAHPGKEFDLPMPDLKNIVEECQRYSDQTRVGSSERKPVIIRVIEVGSTSTAQLERLKTITLPAPGTLCLVSALAVDPAAGSVWSSSLQGQPEWGFVEEVLRQLREPERCPLLRSNYRRGLCLIYRLFSLRPWSQSSPWSCYSGSTRQQSCLNRASGLCLCWVAFNTC
jgi:hypothetical protein